MEQNGAFAIKSGAFKDGELIPAKFTCDGEDISPMLEIKNAPKDTKSFALILEDPDAAPIWSHWVLWNIGPGTQYIDEGTLPQNAMQGTTSSGSMRYGGPCPPKGDEPHHYTFRLYALDAEIENIPPGASKNKLFEAIDGHIIGTAELTGLYQRK